jgi:transcriptional regulator with XRE-family HTH domain
MRLKRELSKTAFAQLVGVPASTITRIESGIVDPTYSMLQKIASGAGFTLSGTLSDVGSDAPYAAAVERIQNASNVERRRLVKKLAQTATLAPVTKRPGVRIFALDRPIGDFVRYLEERGANPTVSSLEAVADDIASTRSFTPVVYVERPEDLDLAPMSPTARSSVIVLPITENVRKFTRWVNGTAMLAPEWGMLDALASPGRQADVARTFLPQLAARVTMTRQAGAAA